MKYFTTIVVFFSILGAFDKIFGNRFGLGKEFEKAFNLLGVMALSMIGMIIISPFLAEIMVPIAVFFQKVLHLDASVIPASLFANDMGGAPMAIKMAANQKIGLYNALVVSSMMGCTISFTIPFAFGVVEKTRQQELMYGFLCGIVTIPVGCFVSGIICKIPFAMLIINLIPLILFSAIIAVGLVLTPNICIKIFKVFSVLISIVITFGLLLGIIRFLTGFEVIKGLATIEEGAAICLNIAIVLSGSFPFMCILSKLLAKPLKDVGKHFGINEISVIGVISTLVTSATAFGMMDKMDKKGAAINSAFAVSGAFVLGSHLAFTMTFDAKYILPVIVGKIVSGLTSVILTYLIFDKVTTKN